MLDITESQPLTLLSLPYDVRFLIYQHLFPSPPQIYLQAGRDGSVIAIIAEGTFPTGLLLTCSAIHSEAAGYLYNTYLFNLIGTKQDCLSSYKGFLNTLRKYAREEVHLNAFTNGVHSDTMCISLHTGDGKMAILRGRRRGVETTLGEIRREVRAVGGEFPAWSSRLIMGVVSIASLLAVMLACVLQRFVSA
jgi:hypothetical protein